MSKGSNKAYKAALKRKSNKSHSSKSQGAEVVRDDGNASNMWRKFASWATVGVMSVVALVGAKTTAFAGGDVCIDLKGRIFLSDSYLKGSVTAKSDATMKAVAAFLRNPHPTIENVPESWEGCSEETGWRQIHTPKGTDAQYEEEHEQIAREALEKRQKRVKLR